MFASIMRGPNILLRETAEMWSFCYGDEMLKLDEKKIRKGKPIGLPYQGSKKKISKKIIEIIKQNFGTDKPIYDIFGGGGAITAECMLNGLEVHYNDLDKDITDMFQRVIGQDREWIKTLIVSREEFFEIKNKDIKTVDDNLKLLVNSFGNIRKTYLYSEEWSDMKYKLAIEIIKRHDVFSGYKQTDIYKNAIRKYSEHKQLECLQQLQQLQQLQRLQQSEQLQQLQRLQQLQQLQQLEQLEVTNLSYEAFSDIEDAIFYLDPPYEETVQDGYKDKKQKRTIDSAIYKGIREKLLKLPLGTIIEHDGLVFSLGLHSNNKNRMYYKDVSSSFDSQKFYDWAFEMSKKNTVLISSYEISDNRFKCVFEFEKARSTMQSGSAGKRTEKLFMAV